MAKGYFKSKAYGREAVHEKMAQPFDIRTDYSDCFILAVSINATAMAVAPAYTSHMG